MYSSSFTFVWRRHALPGTGTSLPHTYSFWEGRRKRKPSTLHWCLDIYLVLLIPTFCSYVWKTAVLPCCYCVQPQHILPARDSPACTVATTYAYPSIDDTVLPIVITYCLHVGLLFLLFFCSLYLFMCGTRKPQNPSPSLISVLFCHSILYVHTSACATLPTGYLCVQCLTLFPFLFPYNSFPYLAYPIYSVLPSTIVTDTIPTVHCHTPCSLHFICSFLPVLRVLYTTILFNLEKEGTLPVLHYYCCRPLPYPLPHFFVVSSLRADVQFGGAACGCCLIPPTLQVGRSMGPLPTFRFCIHCTAGGRRREEHLPHAYILPSVLCPFTCSGLLSCHHPTFSPMRFDAGHTCPYPPTIRHCITSHFPIYSVLCILTRDDFLPLDACLGYLPFGHHLPPDAVSDCYVFYLCISFSCFIFVAFLVLYF